jgi:hypothetical protein
VNSLIPEQVTLGRPRYAYASTRVKWARRLQFVFFWTIAHLLAGAIGLPLAELTVQSFSLQTYSIAVGIFVFEGVILFGKHLVFLKFKELRGIRTIDTLAWGLAGVIVIAGELVEKNTYSEVITSISFNVLRFSTFLTLGLFALLQIIHFFRTMYVKYFSIWSLKINEFIAERFLFSLIRIPAYSVFFIFFLSTAFAVLSIVIAASLFLSIGPIEYFKSMVENVQLEIVRAALFGGCSVGFIGLITGLLYTLRMRGFYVWKKSTGVIKR